MRRFAMIPLAFALVAAAWAQDDAPETEAEDLSRLVFTYDPGSHTRLISALGFSKDKSKLITVGWDFSIQVWSTSTGERLDILRLPPFGREKGYDTGRWSEAAVSPDGTLVAIGGDPKAIGVKEGATRLVIVDVATRQVRRAPLGIGKGQVNGLSFSPDGNRLAVAYGGPAPGVVIFNDVRRAARHELDGEKFVALRPVPDLKLAKKPQSITFDPKGNRLLVAEFQGRCQILELDDRGNNGKVVGEFDLPGSVNAAAWAPDGKSFAISFSHKGTGINEGLSPKSNQTEIRDGSGKLVRTLPLAKQGLGYITSLQFLGPNRLFASSYGVLGKKADHGMIGSLIDLTTDKVRRLLSKEGQGIYQTFGAVSDDGTLAAITESQGMEAVVFRVTDGKIVAHCGNRTPIPSFVGFGNDPKAPAIAWSEEIARGTLNTSAKSLTMGFDLARIEPTGEPDPEAFTVNRLKYGAWSLDVEKKSGGNLIASARLREGSTLHPNLIKTGANALTLVPNGKNAPLVMYARHPKNVGGKAFLLNADGKQTVLFPTFNLFRDMTSSPDGRYVVASTGTHRVVLYRTDGTRYPLLNFIRVNGEWVAWTAEGYYTASPGGEKIIGWAEFQGHNKLATFHPAEKFAKHFRRPDIIKLAIERGSSAEAIKELGAKPADVEKILPPTAELKLLKQTGAKVEVRAAASSGVKNVPVQEMRILLNGRPLPEGRGKFVVPPGKSAEAVLEVDVPGGAHELKLLARSEEGSALSEPLLVTGPKSAGQQPTLHRFCVGINDYDSPGLKLNAAARDAAQVYAALEKNCVGPFNRYGAAPGQLLLNKDASRAAVLKGLAAIRKSAKPGDLVVFFFAGHGIKQDEEFYLLTKEADTSKNLAGASLSGDDLRKALSEIECPVLFIMDACHSARGVKSFRPATDDLTRSLTDDTAGVTILAAAMSHEVANASAENGYFTAGLLKALELGEGVPVDPYDRALYTHHIYSVVFSEVRKASNGRQNPFLNMPWTVSPLVVREAPKK